MDSTAEVLNPIEVIEIDFRRLFNDYCHEYGVEDMAREKQTRFDGAMMYIYRHYFKNNNILKSTPSYTVNNSINSMMTNFNSYDVNILYELYLYLKEFANGYDKLATIAAFKALTGISRQTLWGWRSKEPSSSSLDKDKKMFLEWLTECNEDELKEFNLRNPLGPQEQLNVDHGRREVKMSMSIDAKMLPERTPLEIAAGYGVAAIEDKRGLPEVPE